MEQRRADRAGCERGRLGGMSWRGRQTGEPERMILQAQRDRVSTGKNELRIHNC